MKKITYLLTIAALALQSCSHVAVYREAEYQNGDATYPNETLQFAYPANGDSVHLPSQRLQTEYIRRLQLTANIIHILPLLLNL